MPITVSRQTEALQVSNQSHQSIDLVVSQIGDTALRRSIESCNKLEKLLSDPETSSVSPFLYIFTYILNICYLKFVIN